MLAVYTNIEAEKLKEQIYDVLKDSYDWKVKDNTIRPSGRLLKRHKLDAQNLCEFVFCEDQDVDEVTKNMLLFGCRPVGKNPTGPARMSKEAFVIFHSELQMYLGTHISDIEVMQITTQPVEKFDIE